MPQYTFICQACQKEFNRIMSIAEYEKTKVTCPHCGSDQVEQRWAAFYAITSKKS
jgi:putative FmdB family regulatory protein